MDFVILYHSQVTRTTPGRTLHQTTPLCQWKDFEPRPISRAEGLQRRQDPNPRYDSHEFVTITVSLPRPSSYVRVRR
ncbi:hypothetical protein TNCV_267701 [Trichonephila clavipes]|nr:hypothetical protein TNCV_267701 [Trichonephila clavipes]